MANRPVLLNLDTLTVRPLVRIDGQDYELLNPGELSIPDLHRFGAAGVELASMREEAGKDPSYTDEQVATISATLDRMVRIILRAPDEILSRLTDVHRFRIVETFNGLTSTPQPATNVSAPPPAGAGAAETPTPTSEKS